jgi:hypothetical protein
MYHIKRDIYESLGRAIPADFKCLYGMLVYPVHR